MNSNINKNQPQKIALICSGGLDSICLAYKLAEENKLALIVSFDYGQRHKKELDFARRCATDLSTKFTLFDIANIGQQLTGSALTDKNVEVPEGHYAEDSMRLSFVPNRNPIFLTITFGIAAAHNLDGVAIAVHSGDHYIYPDCRTDFLQAFDSMENLALEGSTRLITPYANKTKAEIVSDGARYHVPFEKTWSCYKGGDKHCGRCGTCVERQEAFYLAGVKDPTSYEDSQYWKTCVND